MTTIAGLASVTFRHYSPERVIALARQAGVDAIEWAGDLHVPPGDLHRARDVGQRTRDAGILPFSYGSYYRAGTAGVAFARVLETALALGATNIRIWVGSKGSADVAEVERQAILGDIARAASVAQQAKISLSLERHGETLTDKTDSTLSLLKQLGHPNLFIYWQPAIDLAHADALAELRALLPWVSGLHVFHWSHGTANRLSLEEGMTEWKQYLAAMAHSPRSCAAYLEFVRDDSEGQFFDDIRTLRKLLRATAEQNDRTTE